jgi:hypothetical protein
VAPGECISARGLARAPLAALEYFGRYRVDGRDAGPPDCPVLMQPGQTPAPAGWHLVARERRPTDRNEIIALYRRQ